MHKTQYYTAQEAMQCLKSGDSVFIHSAAATPKLLVNAMTESSIELEDIEILSIHTEWPAPYAQEPYHLSFVINSFFVGANLREAVAAGRANYVPVFLSEIPLLFKQGVKKIDVALITVSPPDSHGYCSLGVSVDVSKAAVNAAKIVIAEVNPTMPRTFGDSHIHLSQIDKLVQSDYFIHELKATESSPIDLKIGSHIANLVEDGATLQMGIGGIPNAVLSCLSNHKDLGVHTEMFSDGIIPLIEQGVINNSKKKIQEHMTVSSFAVGSRKLYDFMDNNPSIMMREVDFVNSPVNIMRNPKVVAINSAIEVDMFGQVCADSIGSRQYSGVGGQMDFIRGAALSPGGKPIIALPSVTSKGESRIVGHLKQGASVVTTRAHVHYVVTEYGVAYLYGKNLKQRAKALIEIAHPDFQESLDRQAFEHFKYYSGVMA